MSDDAQRLWAESERTSLLATLTRLERELNRTITSLDHFIVNIDEATPSTLLPAARDDEDRRVDRSCPSASS